MQGMKTRVPYIIALVGLALLLLGGFFLAHELHVRNISERNTAVENTHETHQLETSLGYKHEYIGEASNTTALLWSLPLGQYVSTVEIKPEVLSVIATVDGTPEDETLMKRETLYSSMYFMAAVQNAQRVTYNNGTQSFSVSRADLERMYGPPLDAYLEETKWESFRQGIHDDAGELVVVE